MQIMANKILIMFLHILDGDTGQHECCQEQGFENSIICDLSLVSRSNTDLPYPLYFAHVYENKQVQTVPWIDGLLSKLSMYR